MDQEVKKENDILSIASLLTVDNKTCVIAVENALLFTQKHKEKEGAGSE